MDHIDTHLDINLAREAVRGSYSISEAEGRAFTALRTVHNRLRLHVIPISRLFRLQGIKSSLEAFAVASDKVGREGDALIFWRYTYSVRHWMPPLPHQSLTGEFG